MVATAFGPIHSSDGLAAVERMTVWYRTTIPEFASACGETVSAPVGLYLSSGRVDQLLRWHFRQAVLANMRGAGEPVFENDFPPTWLRYGWGNT